MGLSFAETTCGDGVCGIPENHPSCPQDCRSGEEDGYCDAVKDGICDPDCLKGEDADCAENVEEIATTVTATAITPSEVKRTPGFEALEVLAALALVLAAKRKF